MKKKIITISVIALFSTILWISVSLSEIYITTLELPIKFIDLPRNYSLGSSSIDKVFIQVKGPGWAIAKYNLGGGYNYYISVRKRIGIHKENLNDFIESNAWLTSSFKVLEIEPSQIEYQIDKISSKRVPLIKNFKMEFRQGYGPTSEIRIEPQTVEIYGPISILQKIDTLKTEYQEFTDISEDVNVELPVTAPDGTTISNNKCTIDFTVQKIVDKSFDGINVEAKNVPAAKELILYPSKITIIIRGGINKLGKLTNDSLKAYVDYWRALKDESRSIEPIIEIPQFTTLVNTQPKKLEYIIKQH